MVQPYTMMIPNQEVRLYAGPVTLRTSDDTKEIQGDVVYRWLPSRSLELRIAQPISLSEDEASIEIHPLRMKAEAVPLRGDGDEAELHQVLWLGELSVPDDVELQSALFHLVNVPRFHELAVENKLSLDFSLQGVPWRASIAEMPDSGALFQKLYDQSGFAITHHVLVERQDKARFMSGEVDRLENLLAITCSLMRGRWSGPLFGIGIQDDKAVWHDWRFSSISPWSEPQDLVIESQDFAALLEALDRYSKTESDLEHIFLAASLLFEAEDHDVVEVCLILAQTGLELLAWLELVHVQQAISAEGLDRLTAADRLRLLLTQLNLSQWPLGHDFIHLTRLIAVQGWRDPAQAITELRNGVIHPRKMQRTYQSPVMARIEAVELSMYFLHQSIRRVIDSELRETADAQMVTWDRGPKAYTSSIMSGNQSKP